jgi:hypothetical protein
VTRFYYPMKKVARDVILSGEFPSWNPNLSEGQPLAANPEFAVFYPPNWFLLLPDYDLAFRLHILFHYYIAAIGMRVGGCAVVERQSSGQIRAGIRDGELLTGNRTGRLPASSARSVLRVEHRKR